MVEEIAECLKILYEDAEVKRTLRLDLYFKLIEILQRAGNLVDNQRDDKGVW